MTGSRLLRLVAGMAILASLQLPFASQALAAPLSARPQMALTFDDSPLAVTPLLLTLEQKNAKATFFLIGELAELNPLQAESIVSAGMLVGNHSYDHSHFMTATPDAIRANLALAQSAIQAQTGVTPRWFRSPYLDQTSAYDQVLPQLGLKASWPTINPKDWAGPTPEAMISLVLTEAAPGGVVILHDMDNRTNTIEALPGMIDGLRAAGYDLVTLDDIGLGAIEGTATTDGGSPVSGAMVAAYDSQGSLVATASTGADGGYRIERLTPGVYRVGFSSVGHALRYYDGAGLLGGAEPVMISADYTIAGVCATLSADVQPPVTTLSSTLPATWVNHDVAIEPSVSDDGPPEGIKTYIRFDPPGETIEATGSVAVSWEGTTNIAFWSLDAAGNAESETIACVKIDRTPPTTLCDVASSYSGTATIGFAATDAASGVRETYFSLDGGAETSGALVHVDAAGPHALSYRSVDVVGNTEATHTAAFALVLPTSLEASASRSSVRLGDRLDVTAALRDSVGDGRAVEGQPVQIQESADGLGGWSPLDVASTSESGSATFSVEPSRTVYYRAVFVGAEDTYGPSASPPVRVEVLPPLGTRLVAGASAGTPEYGASTMIDGRLLRASATSRAIPGQEIHLQRYAAGAWRDEDASKTTPSGAAVFSVKPTSRSSYRLRYEGVEGRYLGCASPAVIITPKVGLGTPVAPKKMSRARSYEVFGSLSPRHAAGSKPVRIYRYRKVGGEWVGAGYVRAAVANQGATSRYTATVHLAVPGTWRLRAYAPADAGHAATWSSGYVSVKVK